MNTQNKDKFDLFVKSALVLAVLSPLVLVLILLQLLNLKHLQNRVLDIALGILIGICVYHIGKASLSIYILGKIE